MTSNEQIAAFDAALSALFRAFAIREKRFSTSDGQSAYSPHVSETLAFLDKHPGARAKDLGAFLGVTPTTTQSILDRLIDRDLVRRDHQQLKGRAIALFLTDKGNDLRTSVVEQNLANCDRMLNALPEPERSQFVESISRIASAVSNNDG